MLSLKDERPGLKEVFVDLVGSKDPVTIDRSASGFPGLQKVCGLAIRIRCVCSLAFGCDCPCRQRFADESTGSTLGFHCARIHSHEGEKQRGSVSHLITFWSMHSSTANFVEVPAKDFIKWAQRTLHRPCFEVSRKFGCESFSPCTALRDGLGQQLHSEEGLVVRSNRLTERH